MNAARTFSKTVDEDQLTSDIFGLLKYLPPATILWSLLRTARSFEKPHSSTLLYEMSIELPDSAQYFFWPTSKAGEPDLVVLISGSRGERAALVVEIKYTAGKHDRPAPVTAGEIASETVAPIEHPHRDRDQLARYFIALFESQIHLREGTVVSPALRAKVSDRTSHDQRLLDSVEPSKRFLIYLTDDDVVPDEDISNTREALEQGPTKIEWAGRLFWLSWRSFYEAIESTLDESVTSSPMHPDLLRDLLRALDTWELTPFQGWQQIKFNSLYAKGLLRFWNPYWFRDLRLKTVDLVGLQFWQKKG
jgi:hypothetical protein